jgi:hypothetical protein
MARVRARDAVLPGLQEPAGTSAVLCEDAMTDETKRLTPDEEKAAEVAARYFLAPDRMGAIRDDQAALVARWALERHTPTPEDVAAWAARVMRTLEEEGKATEDCCDRCHYRALDTEAVEALENLRDTAARAKMYNEDACRKADEIQRWKDKFANEQDHFRVASERAQALEAELESARQELSDLGPEVERLTKRDGDLCAALSAVESERDAAQCALAQERIGHTAFQDAVEASAKRLEEKVGRIEVQSTEAIAQRDTARSERDALKARVSELEQEVQRMHERFKVEATQHIGEEIELEALIEQLLEAGITRADDAERKVAELEPDARRYREACERAKHPKKLSGISFAAWKAHTGPGEEEAQAAAIARYVLALDATAAGGGEATKTRRTPAEAGLPVQGVCVRCMQGLHGMCDDTRDPEDTRRCRCAVREHVAPAGLLEAVGPLLPALRAMAASPLADNSMTNLHNDHRFDASLGQVRALLAAYDAARAGIPPAPVGLLEAVGSMIHWAREALAVCRFRKEAHIITVGLSRDSEASLMEGHVEALVAAYDAAKAIPSAPLALSCPKCRAPHVDEGEWATRPHKTHQCQSCSHEWRPYPFPTVGVASVPLSTLAEVAEEYAREQESRGDDFDYARAEGVRELVRRVSSGQMPEVLLKQRVVEALRGLKRNAHQRALEDHTGSLAAWAGQIGAVVDLTAKALGLSLDAPREGVVHLAEPKPQEARTARMTPPPTTEPLVERPAIAVHEPGCSFDAHPFQSCAEAMAEARPQQPAPAVVWEGEGVRVYSDGRCESERTWYAESRVIARALADAKREHDAFRDHAEKVLVHVAHAAARLGAEDMRERAARTSETTRHSAIIDSTFQRYASACVDVATRIRAIPLPGDTNAR